MFVGRIKNLTFLEKQYNKQNFEFSVIYGRRRVGKTTLLKKYMNGKRVIYFQGIEANAKGNLEALGIAIDQILQPTSLAISSKRGGYANFTDTLDVITELAQEEKLVFIIDEYPYLAESDRSVSSIIQSFIDHKWKDINFQLILCGSSMSFMENQVLGAKSPLYGRRTAQLLIKPFDFEETLTFLPKMSKVDAMMMLSITGGIPQYLSFVDDTFSVMENIQELFLSLGASLIEEPMNLLKQELREPALYSSALEAIATGSSKMNNISTKSGIETSNLTRVLNNLINLGIVEKITPVGEPQSSKNTLYKIKDGLYRFWYRFIFPNQAILLTHPESLANYIKEQLNDFCGPAFEEVCTSWVLRNIKFNFAQIGNWWGTKTSVRGNEEIDIMALDFTRKQAIFAECKWKNEKVGQEVVEKLIERSELFTYQISGRYLFSKNGFKSGATELASQKGVQLVNFEDMY